MNFKPFKGIKSYSLENASIVQVFDYHLEKDVFIYYSYAQKYYEILSNQKINQTIHRFNYDKDDYSVKPSKQMVNKLPIDYFCQFVGDWIIVTQNYKTWTIININQIQEISKYIQLDRLPGKSISICPQTLMAGTINEQGILIFDLQKGLQTQIQHPDVYLIFDISLNLNFPLFFVRISNNHPYNQIMFETTEKQKFQRNIKSIQNLFYNDKYIVCTHRDSRENGGGRNDVYVHSLRNNKLLFRTWLKTNVHDCRFKHFSLDSRKLTIWHNRTILELDLTNRNLDIVSNGEELQISASNCILQKEYIRQQETIVHISAF